MNKTELIQKIADEASLTKVDARKALEATLEAISDALRADEKVSLIGFGTFSTTVRPEREGRNPLTGETMKIAAKKVVKFKAGEGLI